MWLSSLTSEGTWRAIGWLGVILIALRSAPAATPPANLVHAELIADVAAVEPGKAFTVGLLLHIEPGWHVYWSNPGDTGLPTTLKLTLPAGFALSELHYPIPEKFVQPGDIVAYGYDKEVLLTANVVPPKEVASQPSLDISGQARWLVCSDVCVAGKAALDLKLAVGAKAEPANADVFERWAPQFPQDAARGGATVTPLPVKPAASPVAVQDGTKTLGIAIQWNQPATDVEFYAGAIDGLSVNNIDVRTKNGTTSVTFDARILKGQKVTASSLSGLVVYRNQQNQRVGLNVDVPIDSLMK
jgi:DsbC/DsbD-like thiol-disulfide interchange protein